MQTHISLRRSLSLLGVGAIALTLVGCSKLPGVAQVQQKVEQKVGEQVTKTAASLLTEQEVAGISDPLIRKHLVAQAGQTAYRVTNVPTDKNQGTTVTEIQINGTSVAFHTYEDQNGKHLREMLILGDTTYVKDQTDGSWWKQTAQPQASGVPSTFMTQIPKLSDLKDEFVKKQQTATFTAQGTESCGPAAPTLTCYKYQEVDSDSQEATRTFWFDNQNFLLRQEQRGTGMLTTYAYDNINISAPSPTKDVPDGQSIYMYLVGAPTKQIPTLPSGASQGMPSAADLQKLMEKAKQGLGNSNQ